MKKETNVKRTGCYIRRNRFILGAAAGLLLAAALPFGALGAEKGWQMVDGAERYVCLLYTSDAADEGMAV